MRSRHRSGDNLACVLVYWQSTSLRRQSRNSNGVRDMAIVLLINRSE
jgi:hypothetical protein